MFSTSLTGVTVALSLVSSVVGHACPWHPSMFGFNFTGHDNPPFYPLQSRDFSGETGWWFHGHMAYPPHPTDFLDFPAGGETFVEITCDKGASSYYTSNPGGDIRNGNDVCPGAGPEEYHTTGIDDVKGCAFSIAYTPASKADTLTPEDFVVFTVNQTCVWERFTKFEVPADMPPCPEGGCTCAWHWIHSQDAGSEQMYMNAFQCNITGATGKAPLAKGQLPRRCGANNQPELVKAAEPNNCTYGAKQPLWWDQKENNNMFEGPHAPPFYTDLYNFKNGAQNDIFVNSILPEMAWEGAPVNGKLEQLSGSFPSFDGSLPASSDATPDTSSSSSSASASPSPTSSSSASSDSAASPDVFSSASSTLTSSSEKSTSTSKSKSKTSPLTESSSNSSTKACKKNKMKKRKRTLIDTLRSHRRTSKKHH